MLPLCSAPSSCSHAQILFPGSWKKCSPFLKEFVSKGNAEDTYSVFGTSNRKHHKICIRAQAAASVCSNVENIKEMVNNDLLRHDYGASKIRDSVGVISEYCSVRNSEILYVGHSSSAVAEEGVEDFSQPLTEHVNNTIESINPETNSVVDVSPKDLISPPDNPDLDNTLFYSESSTGIINGKIAPVEPETISTIDVSPESFNTVQDSPNLDNGSFSSEQLTENLKGGTVSVDPETISTIDISTEDSVLLPQTPNLDQESLTDAKTNFEDVFSEVKESFSTSLNKGESSLKNTLDSISSSITSIKQSASQAVDETVGRVFSTVDQTGNLAGNKVLSFSTDTKEASRKAAVIATDLLRQAIIKLEKSVGSGVSFLVDSFESAKELLPNDIQNAFELSENTAIKVFKPVGSTLLQVYIAIEGLERSIGLDPDDPIVNFVLFLGTSGTFWILYRLWVFGGYAGDLPPKVAFELLMSREKTMLIDIRPEGLRETDGVPDLRRAARFRYASVTLPEVDGALTKMLRSRREVDDIITAAVIKNLKAVQDRSKVIVMDADGSRSKGIARALRKIGIKRPYLVHGGYKSWIKDGLRVKELKPETTFTILNEEAEAILEEINPSPLQLVGVGAGIVAGLYALLEWEKTLQLIGVFGIGQSIYRRIGSYEDSEDFKQDVRQLLAPVNLGAEAFSWAVGKLDSNRNGLPTSPSSSDVQSRVLQAVAKHESQPSDSNSDLDPSTDDTSSGTESVDLSEA